MAVTVPVTVVEMLPALAVNAAVRFPAVTVTLAGTVRRDELDFKVTTVALEDR